MRSTEKRKTIAPCKTNDRLAEANELILAQTIAEHDFVTCENKEHKAYLVTVSAYLVTVSVARNRPLFQRVKRALSRQ